MIKLTGVSASASLVLVDVNTYALGPLDAALLVEHHLTLDTGWQYRASVPRCLPASVTDHADFWDGLAWGYSCEEDLDPRSPMKLANWLEDVLRSELLDADASVDAFVWICGYVVGGLASLAEHDATLASVGLAHFCFLLSFIPLSVDRASWYHALVVAGQEHDRALRAYRTRLRTLTSQGVPLHQAYHDAYQGQVSALN